MKIILSRKGFDSTAGGVPSPILPGGRLVALPIPDPLSSIRYGDIGSGGRDIGRLVSNLTGGRIRRTSCAHLDPDLVASDLPRHPDWRPIFGQLGAAQGHLRNQGVGPGDLFVFFGLFQATRWHQRRLVRDRSAARKHVIWGWLQVDRIIPVDACPQTVRAWAGYHPHCRRRPEPNNVLYIARRWLSCPGVAERRMPGAGIFPHYSQALCLTEPGASGPSQWRLPGWCVPRGGRFPFSYHASHTRWSKAGGRVRLRSAARGQEFVLSVDAYPEALDLVRILLPRMAH